MDKPKPRPYVLSDELVADDRWQERLRSKHPFYKHPRRKPSMKGK